MIFGGAGVVAAELSSERIRDGLKKALSDWIDEWLFGADPLHPEKRGSKRQKVSYQAYYTNRHNIKKKSNIYPPDDILFDTREDANKMLDSLKEIADAYGYVTAADYCDLADLPCNDFTANKYGWYTSDVEKMLIEKRLDGYKIVYPSTRRLAV